MLLIGAAFANCRSQALGRNGAAGNWQSVSFAFSSSFARHHSRDLNAVLVLPSSKWTRFALLIVRRHLVLNSKL